MSNLNDKDPYGLSKIYGTDMDDLDMDELIDKIGELAHLLEQTKSIPYYLKLLKQNAIVAAEVIKTHELGINKIDFETRLKLADIIHNDNTVSDDLTKTFTVTKDPVNQEIKVINLDKKDMNDFKYFNLAHRFNSLYYYAENLVNQILNLSKGKIETKTERYNLMFDLEAKTEEFKIFKKHVLFEE